MKRIYSLIVSSALLMALPANAQLHNNAGTDPTIYHGSTDVKDVFSPALEGNLQGTPSTQPVKVYLPPHYENLPENRYPVLFLLHHYTQDYNLYFSHYNIVENLDRLISQKVITPMILVTPNAKTEYDGTWYTNSYVSGNWEDYITNDVARHMANHYNVLDQRESRGLAGYGNAAYGVMNIAMKHPSAVGSIATILIIAKADMESLFSDEQWKQQVVEAAQINEYRPADPWYIRAKYAAAVDFAPDSLTEPIKGRLPYSAEGDLIDSIKQEWMEHDPLTNLEVFMDSLLKLNSIQLFAGDDKSNETFHQTMINLGIDHGFTRHSGLQITPPLLDSLLIHFSESLFSVVPTVSAGKYSHTVNDTLVVLSDMDGNVIIVPDTVDPGSINIYPATDVIANEGKEITLSEFEPGNYLVFASSNDGMVSNIPAEFSVIPDENTCQDTVAPVVTAIDSLYQADSIEVTSSEDGIIYLVETGTGKDLETIRENYMDSVIAVADIPASMSLSTLDDNGSYWLYALDSCGNISEPHIFTLYGVSITLFKEEHVQMFPNPVTTTLTLKLRNKNRYSVQITSINGQLIRKEEIKVPTHLLDLSSFEKGVYFITIRSKDFVTTKKIIKL